MPPHGIFASEERRCCREPLSRLQGHEKDGKLRALQDCVLFCRRIGLAALIAKISDYDVLLQLVRAGRALFYRRK
jgi:hypothetical protein